MFTRESRALTSHPPITSILDSRNIEINRELGANTITSPKSPRPLQVRSTKGCWTCRLRKKKCDETQPLCGRCTSVNINCYYGRRPVWIGDRGLAKEELERIKPTIAASASRKRAAYREKSKLFPQEPKLRSPGMSREDGKEPHEVYQDLSDGSSLPSPMEVNPECAPQEDINTGNDRESNEALPLIHSTLSCDTTISPRSVGYNRELHATGSSNFDSRSPIMGSEQIAFEAKKAKQSGSDEANLMMHYLDNVFYIQFRFFTPSIEIGGRGWLLSLLNRTKPLYHAAVSLSAFHQQSIISRQGADQAQMDYLHQLELHHNLTLEELQLFIHAHTESTSLGGGFSGKVQILACMVQLISFELFNGGTGIWQVHLGAASKLILELQSMCMENSSGHGPQDLVKDTNMNDVSRSDMAAFEFFASAIIWFDIVACVSTGSKPHLAEHHSTLLSQSQNPITLSYNATFKLESIMGCQSWAMAIIGQIPALANTYQEDNGDSQQVAIVAKEIHSRLELRRNQTFSSIQSLRQEHRGAPPHYMLSVYTRYTNLVVTYIFASAAVIYLQTVTTANPTIAHIQKPLQDVISAINLVPDPRMVRGMLWPLCVAGCMASSSADQNFFREKAEDAVRDSGMVGNSGKAMEILEMSWVLQGTEGRLVDCATCIKNLGTCVLLA